MIDPKDIEGFEEPSPQVEAVAGLRLSLVVSDPVPEVGAAVRMESDSGEVIFAVVRRLLGRRRVEAWMPEVPTWVRPGVAIEVLDEPAGFEIPADGRLVVDASTIGVGEGVVPLWPEAPRWADLRGELRPVPTGVHALDVLAPVPAGGLVLVFDESGAGFAGLARRVEEAVEPELRVGLLSDMAEGGVMTTRAPTQTLEITYHGQGSGRDSLAAVQFLIALAPWLREQGEALVTVELELPDERAYGVDDGRGLRRGVPEILGLLTRHLVSTKEAEVTTLVHLRLPPSAQGLSDLIETFTVGDVDAMVVIDEEGGFDPGRSSSRAVVSDEAREERRRLLRVLETCGKAETTLAIFGEADLTEEEREALEELRSLRVRL